METSALKLYLEKNGGSIKDFITGSKGIINTISDLGKAMNKHLTTEEIKTLQKQSFKRGLATGGIMAGGTALGTYGIKKYLDKKNRESADYLNKSAAFKLKMGPNGRQVTSGNFFSNTIKNIKDKFRKKPVETQPIPQNRLTPNEISSFRIKKPITNGEPINLNPEHIAPESSWKILDKKPKSSMTDWIKNNKNPLMIGGAAGIGAGAGLNQLITNRKKNNNQQQF